LRKSRNACICAAQSTILIYEGSLLESVPPGKCRGRDSTEVHTTWPAPAVCKKIMFMYLTSHEAVRARRFKRFST